jgi:hypothetical protein
MTLSSQQFRNRLAHYCTAKGNRDSRPGCRKPNSRCQRRSIEANDDAPTDSLKAGLELRRGHLVGVLRSQTCMVRPRPMAAFAVPAPARNTWLKQFAYLVTQLFQRGAKCVGVQLALSRAFPRLAAIPDDHCDQRSVYTCSVQEIRLRSKQQLEVLDAHKLLHFRPVSYGHFLKCARAVYQGLH